jgi:glycosyltransferase involved in cell wall biosynthesis
MGLADKFIAVYAGIHGLAQGLETIIETACILQKYPQIHFLLIGDGPKKQEILSQVKDNNLLNLTCLPEKPRELIPTYLSTSDVALVPLRKAEIFKGALPSKIFDAWSCERPVLLSIDGEARQIVEAVNGGVYVPPEDAQEMAATLINLMGTPKKLEVMGKNGREYTLQNHSRKVLAENLISYLEQLVKQ